MLFHDCHQVYVIEPASDAVVRHAFNAGKIEVIRDFLRGSEFPSYVLASIQKLTKSGLDITPLLPVVLKYFPKNEFDVYRILVGYVKRNESEYAQTLAKVAEMIVADPKARPYIARLVQEGAIDKMDMAPALPSLIKVLKGKSKRAREDAASALYWAVEGKTDFSTVVKDLQRLFESGTDQEDRVVYCLAYHYAKTKDWQEIAKLMQATRPEARLNAYRALAVLYNHDAKGLPALLSSLLEGLADPDPYVSAKIFDLLLNTDNKKIPIIPSESRLLEIVGMLGTKEESENLKKYLYFIASKNTSVAHTILDGLNRPPIGANPQAVRLREQIEALLAGEHNPVCSICRQISRRNQEIPREAKVLKLPAPSLGTGSAIRKCPECGIYYYYEYEQEYDDMSLDTTIILRRMDPAEVLERLEGDEREQYVAQIPHLIDDYRDDLAHPEEFARVEAAWMLTRYIVATSDWKFLADLLTHEDPIVRRAVFQELSTFEGAQIPAGNLSQNIRTGLQDYDVLIRRDASTILAKWAIVSKDFRVLQELLTYSEPEIVSSAGQQVWRAVRNEDLDISLLKPDLIAMLRSNDSRVRSMARHALIDAGKTSGGIDPGIFITNLGDPDPEVRDDAASALAQLAQQRYDISPALQGLGKLLTDKKTVYSGLKAILNAVSWAKTDITPVIPGLIGLLESDLTSYHGDACQILYYAIEHGLDVSVAYPVLGKRIARLQYSATNIFDIGMKRGHDISLLEPYLLKILPRLPTDAFGEDTVKYLAYIYLKKKNWEALKGLLEHKNKHVPGPTACLLAEKDVDYSPLLPNLARNLYHSYWYVRSEAASALKQLARQNPALEKRIKQTVTQSAPNGA